MNENNSPLAGFDLFDNSGMTRVVNKITITKSHQLNFPAAFYSINNLEGKKGVMLYFNKAAQKIAVQFVDEVDPKGFKLALSNGGKYGAYISAKSFFALNNIDIHKFADRYDYEKVTSSTGDILFIIDLANKEEGGVM